MTDGVILAAPCTACYMLSADIWRLIALVGLVFSGIAGIVSRPWAAVAFTVLYGAAVLSIVRFL